MYPTDTLFKRIHFKTSSAVVDWYIPSKPVPLENTYFSWFCVFQYIYLSNYAGYSTYLNTPQSIIELIAHWYTLGVRNRNCTFHLISSRNNNIYILLSLVLSVPLDRFPRLNISHLAHPTCPRPKARDTVLAHPPPPHIYERAQKSNGANFQPLLYLLVT